jgi:hypothetical protein
VDREIFLRNLAGKKTEQENYIQDHPEWVEKLRALHDAWAKEVQPKW